MSSLPSGSWPSPITPEFLVAGALGISETVPTADAVWWAESRPGEGGRTALMRLALAAGGVAAGEPVEVTPAETNVRTTVHEYGGGAWWAENDVCWYVSYADQRLHRLRPGEAPVALSPAPPTPQAWRYADFRPTPDGAWLVGVCERHEAGAREPRNLVVAIATDGSERVVDLVEGADFYGSPRLSPDGAHLAWIEWMHPNMPWDDTTLRTAELVRADDGIAIGESRIIAGGPDRMGHPGPAGLAGATGAAGVAIVQPEWSPDGRLHYLSDRLDRWQLFADDPSADDAAPVFEVEGEIGYPPWVFGLSRYAFMADGRVIAARFEGGIEYLEGHEGYTAFHSLRSCGDRLAFVGASFSSGPAVVLDGRVVRAARKLDLDPELLAPPEVIRFATGARSSATETSDEHAFGLFYAPANPEYETRADERPPLVVLAHGGPTSAARSQLNLGVRFWTSRGFAVVDVNYRGSSGFGRAYRKKLDGAWGIADVEDCVAAARYLVARGDVDGDRLIIRGGSAGGFTVLSALAFHDTFTAGASLYGVADLEALATDTHKFESRYLDSLIGPWPEAREIYEARSPIHHLEGFDAPMIVLQGSEDRIVPPNQSRMIVAALETRGVPVAYLEFEGEQHGFRKADTIVRAQSAELAFYGRVFGFEPAGEPVELDISNLE